MRAMKLVLAGLAAALILAWPTPPVPCAGPAAVALAKESKDEKPKDDQVIIIRGKGGKVTEVDKRPKPKNGDNKQ